MLIWLEGHASPQILRDNMLESDEYRDRVFLWLESIIKCEFPEEMSLEQASLSHPTRIRHRDVGNPHPGTIPLPTLRLQEEDMSSFWRNYGYVVEQLLYQYNWHDHTPTCWKYLKRGQEQTDANCRMGMDGTTQATTCLDSESARIMLRRRHPKISAYTDLVTFLVQCNMNAQFVGSGDQAKSFIYYVTDYVTKASLSVHVGMAALAFAVRRVHERGFVGGIQSGNDQKSIGAVIMAVNSMMARQEISHPQVMSYLVGGGDHYTSEKFSAMQWGAIERYVSHKWDSIEAPEISERAGGELDGSVNVTITENEITISNQQVDYSFRNTASNFETLCLYDFVAWTAKVRLSEKEKRNGRTLGRFNQEGHPQQESHYLILRRVAQIPVLLGPSIPNPSKSPVEKETWSRYMLILFKPWRDVLDLKNPAQSWTDAYESSHNGFSRRQQQIIKNMTVLTECSDARE